MKSELHKFEFLIDKYCYGDIELSNDEYNMLKKEIEDEDLRIKEALINNYFTLKKKYQLENYVRQHQIRIIRLFDSVFQKLSPIELRNLTTFEKSKPEINIRKLLYQKLESLLSFIESYFSTYFDQEDMIPKRYQLIARNEFKREFDSENNFQEQKRYCPLLTITTSPLDEFIKSKDKVSFRQLVYLKKLFREILKYCRNCQGDYKLCSMKSKLIYLNFNSYRFFSFLTTQIIAEYLDLESINQQIEALCYHLKKINQAQEKPGFVYRKEIKSLKDQLSIWLIEEIAFLEKKQELYNNPDLSKRKDFTKDFKLITECSVSQVAYFIRLLVDAGAITNKNQREIINFFASCIKTKKATNISPESFRTKYYNTESSTIEAVKGLIIKMLNKTNDQLK